MVLKHQKCIGFGTVQTVQLKQLLFICGKTTERQRVLTMLSDFPQHALALGLFSKVFVFFLVDKNGIMDVELFE